jgi:hypothetical protein
MKARKLYEVVAVTVIAGQPAPVKAVVVPACRRKDAEEKAYELNEAMLRGEMNPDRITSYSAVPA